MARKKPGWSPALKQFWITIALLGCGVWGAGMVIRLMPPFTLLGDFAQEWTSARNYLTGHPVYLDMAESIPLHLGGRSELIKVNAHPPASILLAVPFALLGYDTAFLAWTLVSLIALAFSIHLIFQPQGLNLSAWLLLPMLTFLITSNSLAQQVNQGQLNLILLVLITGAWSALRHSRPWLGGALIGLAAGVKLFPAYLLLYVLMQRQWKALAAGILGIAAVNGLTALVFGVSTYQDYVFDVMPQVGEFRDYWANASLTGFWSRLFVARSGHTAPLFKNELLATALIGIGSLVVTGMTAWKAWRAQTEAERDWAFCLCIIAMTLVSPITWDHYFLLFLLPFCVLWKYSRPTLVNHWMIVIAIVGLCFINPVWIWNATIPGNGELITDPEAQPSVGEPKHSFTVLGYQFYLLLGLFLFAWRRHPVANLRPSEQPLPAPKTPAIA